jgi:NAD(P)-dependent dehydrogenase (short-subunit alcohol dehydrogenase family)
MSVVLITGCSSGIGLESALAFARNGDTVYATMRNPAKAESLLRRAAADGVSVEVLALDVTDDESVASCVREIESRHDAVDVLVNNAGIGSGGAVETIDMADARAVMETNLWGAVRAMRAVLPAMRAKAAGVIINVTSVSGRVPGTAYEGWYGASKHALNALSEAMVMELGPFGVRLVCIEPGFFRTEINANADVAIDPNDPYAADHAWMKEFFDKSVEAGGGDPSIVADAIVRAADDPETPVHTLVGDDAAMFVDLVSQAGTMEAWLPIGTSIVESVAGPRPVEPRGRH